MKSIKIILSLVICICLIPLSSKAQIAIDQGIRAGKLWCFPKVNDPNVYLYLPGEAHLAMDEAGDPMFSFLRYVINEASNSTESSSISKAGGGAVLNFLVEYQTPQEDIVLAQDTLQEILENDEIIVAGPILFDQGKYTLISSILKDGQSEKEWISLASGNAPVLEGNRIALSFELSPERSKLMLESFKSAAPDLSLVFELGFSGLTDGFEAEMEVNWSEVSTHTSMEASGNYYYVSAQAKAVFDELIQDRSIVLRTKGEDINMQGLIQTVYDKLLTLLFQPAEVQKEEEKPLDATDLIKQIGGKSMPALNAFGFKASFTRKEIRKSGSSVFNFDAQSKQSRTHFLTMNVGRLYDQYGKDPQYFRTFNMDDPSFRQRTIFVGIDGELKQELDRLINSVTVSLRKVHANQDTSLQQVLIRPELLKENPGEISMLYGSQEDSNRVEWLNYEYRSQWNFTGGAELNTEWQAANGAMINLFTPYERKTIQIIGETEGFDEQEIRAVVVQVKYPFFGQQKTKQKVIKAGDALDDATFEITLPNGEFGYDYKITWIFSGRERHIEEGRDDTGILFIDEIPATKTN